MDASVTNFGAHVRALRLERGLSQEEVANSANADRKTGDTRLLPVRITIS